MIADKQILETKITRETHQELCETETPCHAKSGPNDSQRQSENKPSLQLLGI